MKTVYTYVLNTLADWECGLTLAELNSQRFFERHSLEDIMNLFTALQPPGTDRP